MLVDTQALGWLAAVLMLATFACQSMLGIRVFGVGANLAFIAYGWQADLMPVLALHLLLLPINAISLARALRASRRCRAADSAADRSTGHAGAARIVRELKLFCRRRYRSG